MTRRRKPLPAAIQTTRMHALSHEGRGITSLDGKTTFVHNALIDETVAWKYTHSTRSYNEGIALEVTANASMQRVPPFCPHYAACGGCQLQHMASAEQCRHKQAVLLEQLHHFGQVTPNNILPMLSGQLIHYRHKARLGVRFVAKKDHRVLVGFRERNGRYLADLRTCDILHPHFGKKLPELAALIQRLSGFAHIPQIEIAVGENKAAMLLRHQTPLTAADVAQLEAFGQQHDILIYSHPNPPEKIAPLFARDTPDYLHYSLPKHGVEIRFHPTDFTQINPEMNRLLIDRALELLDLQPHESCLDLFCGIGNFSLAMARYAGQVVGVEGVESAVTRARDNAAHNHIDNAEFFCADLSQDCQQQPWYARHYDKILLDPSRAGAEAMMHALPALGAKTVVYVSCNPATLARDVGILVHNYHYTLEAVGIVNMFPHTAHVESIALLRLPAA